MSAPSTRLQFTASDDQGFTGTSHVASPDTPNMLRGRSRGGRSPYSRALRGSVAPSRLSSNTEGDRFTRVDQYDSPNIPAEGSLEHLAANFHVSTTPNTIARMKEDFLQAWLSTNYISDFNYFLRCEEVHRLYRRDCKKHAIPHLNTESVTRAIKQCFSGVTIKGLRFGKGIRYYCAGMKPIKLPGVKDPQGPALGIAALANRLGGPITSSTGADPECHNTPTLLSMHLGEAPSVEIRDLSPIRASGYCDIYMGHHLSTGARLAIKRLRTKSEHLNDTVMEVIRREAQFWSSLHHHNLLPFNGMIESRGWIYLVSPWMERGSLSALVKRRSECAYDHDGPISRGSIFHHPWFNEARTIFEVASGIDYLHSMELVHGDIRCGNVLLAEDGHALLCDFGVTKALDASDRSFGLMIGARSLRWHSPELFDNFPKSLKSDVYAFAMLIVEVLTGDAPFPNLSIARFIDAIVYKQERPPFVPLQRETVEFGPLWTIASRCWQTLPQNRPTMNEVLKDLDHSNSNQV